MSINFQGSVVLVKEIKTSRIFYEELLGQKVVADFGPVVGFEAGFSIWQVNHAYTILFEKNYDEAGELGHGNFELCFEDDEIRAIWGKISSTNVSLVHPLQEQPWGQLVFRIYDPDKHIIEIGEPIPVFVSRFLAEGMSVEEVANRTSVPEEVVQKISDGVKHE